MTNDLIDYEGRRMLCRRQAKKPREVIAKTRKMSKIFLKSI